MSEGAQAKRALVVGDVMTDIIVVAEGPVRRGSDQRARIVSRPGGSGANQAVWLARFGVPVDFVARVGDADRDGLTARFRAAGVTAHLIGDTARETGKLVTLVDTDGERSFLTDRAANLALSVADLPGALLDPAALLVISGYSLFEAGPRDAVLWLMAAARERGVPMAVDPASLSFLEEVGAAPFLAMCAGAAILSPNSDEAAFLTGQSDWRAQLDALCARFVTVLLKRGAAGAVLGTRDGRRLSEPAIAVAARDTTGAGDAFLARYLAGWLDKAAPAQALAAAVMAGSEAAGRLGGRPTD